MAINYRSSLGDAIQRTVGSTDNSLLNSLYGGQWNGYSTSMKKAVKNGLQISPADVQASLLEQQLALDTYNQTESFQAQVSQMKDAGLNPSLMYGGTSPSTGGASAPSVDNTGTASKATSGIDAVGALISSVMPIVEGINKMSSLGANLENLKLENDSLRIQNQYAGQKYEAEIDSLKAGTKFSEASIKEKDAMVEQIKANRDKVQQEIENLKTEKEKKQAETFLTWVQSAKTEKEYEQMDDYLALEKKKVSIQQQLANQSGQLTSQQIVNMKRQLDVLDCDIVLKASQIGLVDAQSANLAEQAKLTMQKTETEKWNTKSARVHSRWSHVHEFTGTMKEISETAKNCASAYSSVMTGGLSSVLTEQKSADLAASLNSSSGEDSPLGTAVYF